MFREGFSEITREACQSAGKKQLSGLCINWAHMLHCRQKKQERLLDKSAIFETDRKFARGNNTERYYFRYCNILIIIITV